MPHGAGLTSCRLRPSKLRICSVDFEKPVLVRSAAVAITLAASAVVVLPLQFQPWRRRQL